MPTSTPSPATTPQSHTDAIEAGSSDGHDSANASPRSQQSRLSSSSASSSSEDAHHHDRRQSQYHDIGYLNTLAQSGAGEGGQFRIVRGSEARHILGQYQNDAVFRHKSGPLVIARSAVTDTGRRIVDYARTWRGDTKAHRNKGPRKDFLSGEFKRAKDIQQYFEHELTTKIPEEEAAQHDQQLKHTLKEFDKEFRRMSTTSGSPSKLPHSKHPSPRHSGDKTLPPSPANKELSLTPPDSRSPRHSPSNHSESLPRTSSGHRKSSRENKHPDVNTLLPQPSSATASVQSIPRLGPIRQDLAAHEQPLRIVNPDPNSPTATSFSSEGISQNQQLVIVVLDDNDDYNDWELKHPTAVLRRTPTSRKSRWDGPLVRSGDSSEERTESVVSPLSSHSRNLASPGISTPSKNVTPLKISPAVYAPPTTYSLGTPATGYVPQVPAYTPQSIYAPPAPSPYSSYAPASGQSSPYANYSPYGSALSPFGGSTVTLSPPANVGYTNQGYGPFSPYGTSQASLSPPYAAAPINLTSPSYHYMGL